jgi:hypothetical protein
MAVMKRHVGGSRRIKLPTPGVGSYEVEKSLKSTMKKILNVRIGTSTRVNFNNSPIHFPGPAQYNVNDMNRTKQHSPRPFFGTS